MPNSESEGEYARGSKRNRLKSDPEKDESDCVHTNAFSKRKKPKCEPERHPIVKDESECAHTYPSNACRFCHSSITTEDDGPMQRFHADGKPVKADEADYPTIINVHERCLMWTPQVYFDGETAMNLKAELGRASKLKCSSCGGKGAALGCYDITCNRSYHIPCAFQLPKCRWDLEKYHMLCPQHSSKEFPYNKAKGQKKTKAKNSSPVQIDCPSSLDEAPTSSKQPREECWEAAPHITRVWVLCGSALSAPEKDLLHKFTNMTSATVTELWEKYATHVIASTDEHGACSRTLKVLMATLSGKWVLSINWIKACMESKQPVDEEQYEIGLDCHGCVDGPKKGRLRAMKKEPKLFVGLSFYFSGYFKLAFKSSYEKLVAAAGGTVLTKDEFLVRQSSNTSGSSQTSYVVYNADPPRDCSSTDATEIVLRRHEQAKEIAEKSSAQVVDHQWLVDAIASSSLEPRCNDSSV